VNERPVQRGGTAEIESAQLREATAEESPALASPRDLRFGGGASLRTATARGVLINAAFAVGLSAISALKGFTVAALLSSSDYGLWGFLAATLGSLGFLKQVGINDKYVQQDESDQELAFQKAFTLEALISGGFLLLMAGLVPLLAFAYGLREVLAPGLVLALAIPSSAMQAPLWVFFRRMEFVKQRSLQAISPVVGFLITVPLAVAGLGYWALVVGLVVGSWAGALAAILASPYKLRFRFDRATARAYFSFSWPVFLAGASIVAVAQVPVLVATDVLGLAAVGAIALANLIPVFARQASDVITQTMYPGVCAVKDRPDLLLESFSKSNRLGILWGVPVGVGLALFAPALVEFVLGEKWEFAVGLLQAMGAVTALNQFGFNWTAFYRARGRTKPIAVAHLIQAAAICGIAVPLMVSAGLDGFALGMASATVVYLVVRTYYLAKLFPKFSLLRHSLRAALPTLPAALAVLAVRAIAGGETTPALAAGELVLYLAAVGIATALMERNLVREVIGYLRGQPPLRPSAA
jgi:O-antigen/teichoic acid export membrane protein